MKLDEIIKDMDDLWNLNIISVNVLETKIKRWKESLKALLDKREQSFELIEDMKKEGAKGVEIDFETLKEWLE